MLQRKTCSGRLKRPGGSKGLADHGFYRRDRNSVCVIGERLFEGVRITNIKVWERTAVGIYSVNVGGLESRIPDRA